jgi:cobalt/nickel transport protein
MEVVMRKKARIIIIMAAILGMTGSAFGHFGMVIPSDNMIMQNEKREVNLHLSFSHPMEVVGMDLEQPKVFSVWDNGKEVNLRDNLKQTHVMDHKAWQLDYQIKRPGIYMFFMEPQPYWEPTEDVFIIHYTKTVVTAFGSDEGWDEEIGLKTEIVPLSKPFGLYSGNVFQGIVKMDGKAIPFAEVEVEFYNSDNSAQAPTEYMITQTIKADNNGVFTYAAPKSGWWGFAALNEADFKLKTKSGEEKGVELGAVIWVHFEDWQQK